MTEPAKPGEALVRAQIKEMDQRITALNSDYEHGRIGWRTRRYRLRWLHADYDKLEALARRYGFDVE